MYSFGAVGFALKSASRPVPKATFPTLSPVTSKLIVTRYMWLLSFVSVGRTYVAAFRAEGNLIHEFDGANPSRILLSAIQQSDTIREAAKEGDFYLGVLRGHEVHLGRSPSNL